MTILLRSRVHLSGANLSTQQTIMFHHLLSRNTNDFSKRLQKHFSTSLSAKEDALIEMLGLIDKFENGVFFVKATGRTAGALIKPFNYVLKPFLVEAENKRGAAHLITELSNEDVAFLTDFKNRLKSVLIKLN